MMLLFGFAVALNRTEFGAADAFQPRYFLLLTMWYLAFQLLLMSFRGDKSAKLIYQIIAWGGAALAVGIGIVNVGAGWRYASFYQSRHADVMDDVESGLPLRLIAEKHFGHPFGLYAPSSDVLYERLESMRSRKFGPIGRAKPSPLTRRLPADDVSLSFDPTTGQLTLPSGTLLHGMVWQWSFDTQTADPRVFLGLFAGAENERPFQSRVYRVGRMTTRQSLPLNLAVDKVQFAAVDRRASLLIGSLVFLVVDGERGVVEGERAAEMK